MFTDTHIWHDHPPLAADLLFDELPVGGRSVARHWTRDRQLRIFVTRQI
jgi:hypothetical protein